MSKKEMYKDNICTLCGGELVPINPSSNISKLKCIKCGAIFYNLNDYESGHRGEFTGRYGPVTIDHRYDETWGKNQKPIV